MRMLSDIIQKNKIKPIISKTYHFDDVPDAFNDMLNNRHFGKIVIEL